MSLERWPAHLALVAALLAALNLAACGRKGGLDLPPDAAGNPQVPAPVAANPAPQSVFSAPTVGPPPAAQNGFDAAGNPMAPPGKKSGFILDPLLN